MNKFYYCYSVNQLKFLKQQGLRYLCAGNHDKTGCKYWIFEKSEMLNKVLNEYKIAGQKLKK